MTSDSARSLAAKEIVEKLLSQEKLSRESLEFMFSGMLAGDFNGSQIAAILGALRICGEDGAAMAAGASAMRRAASAIVLGTADRPLADNCGTGGDGSHSFNISTAAAIVAAAAGVRVAKHGNRSVSSKCGSADLLFAAGLPDAMTPPQVARLLEKTGFTFFFAPHFHPGMKHIMPVRQALGVRTIFNLLGPLANPIRPEVQVIGVGAAKYLTPMAEAAKQLGMKRALIVHSRDGLDEISPAAPTDARFLDSENITAMVIDPKAFGIKGSLSELSGGDSLHNLQMLQHLLEGKDHAKWSSTLHDTVALNAGALLWLCGKTTDMGAGINAARDILNSGKGKSFFQNWLAVAQNISTEKK